MAEEQPNREGAAEQENAGVLVYSRPGCPFCTSLRAGLRKHGVSFDEVNIWEDGQAAATVRSLAAGNETVPTVVVGSWSGVNPSAEEVRAAAAEHAPAALPASEPGLVDGTMRALGLRRGDS
ncbi:MULTISPECIES: glutaredoxin family protein [Actinopolyspora]|uniref:Glutaredoxin n=1 Tax=Actinopolyspora saharensis TaxID=995062 RepID=A0A1H1FS29_9ACTN|nr:MULTISPECIES: glutaredoxin domain-containing protein [Actinopolyspora]NHD19463.1 NrdH-redoxin [Actinopolyspora sp. BKK2]NHE77403.1 NrdH-redoxin [Actinopolyspora sp. BKK1]SDR03578.1 Glutaredoxin [Actinopolyspora saharensis]